MWATRLAGASPGGPLAARLARTSLLSQLAAWLRLAGPAAGRPPWRSVHSSAGPVVRAARHRPCTRAAHAIRAVHSASAGSVSKSLIVDPEHRDYWAGVLQGVEKPTAAKLLDHVDPSYLLGLPPAEAAGPPALGTRRKSVPVLAYFMQVKRQHPTKVVLVRVGEFFESVGIDAVLLVQHAGLNPMGAGNPPRAGCPRVNLRRTVADLVHAGLSVVVCEEASEGYIYGYRRTSTKERYIAQVVTPASPHLLYGLIDEDADVALDSTPPLLAVAEEVGGFTTIEVNVELFKVTVTRGLTEEAVFARLYEGGLSPPLFVYTPTGSGGRELSSRMAPWGQRVAQTFRTQAGSVEQYGGANPVDGLVARVRQLLDLPVDAHFTQVSSRATDQPRPLYHSTAANLGLHSSRGVPPLLDCLLPPSTPAAARAWMRGLLLFPPPPRVGAAVLAACRQLRELEVPVPRFPSVGVTNVVLKLTMREANDIFFRELGALCDSVRYACCEDSLIGLSRPLLQVASHATGLSPLLEEVAEACREVRVAIDQVVEPEERLAGGGGSAAAASIDEDAALGDERKPGDATAVALARFREANENRFRGRVQNACIRQQHDAVEAAWSEVEGSVRSMMASIAAAQQAQQAGGAASSSGKAAGAARAASTASCYLVYNANNNAVWVKAGRGSVEVVKRLGLDHPQDRFGAEEKGYYSLKPVDRAQDAYRKACVEAAAVVKRQLQELAGAVQAHMPRLVSACMFATAATALTDHLHEAERRGWALPSHRYPPDFIPAGAAGGSRRQEGADPHQQQQQQQQRDMGSEDWAGGSPLGSQQAQQAQQQGGGALEVRGMWPYWLDVRAEGVVKNDCHMEGMYLLTGPNMAGKSTLLRSLCAVSLLAACGLAVPAAAAAVPYLDAFMLRNFSADSPVDGRSSFAVEMTEMRYVLGDVTPFSLVLVDELGKGTEVRAGAALAGAMLEDLAHRGCKGVFATHLHVLLDMDLQLPGVELMQMEVQPLGQGGGLVPTRRMLPGSSRESLALEVARDCQVPDRVLSRAAQLYAGTHAVVYAPPGQQAQQAQQQQQGEHLLATGALSSSQAEAGEQPSAAAVEGAAPALRSIQQAGTLLADTAAHVLAALQQAEAVGEGEIAATAAAAVGGSERSTSSSSSSSNAPTSASNGAAVPTGLQGVSYVGPGQDPPPRTTGCACVYIARRPDGYFYAGSTDDLRKRINNHRSRKPSSSSRVGGGPGIEVAYVALVGGEGGGSSARALERATIQALQREGFPLLSTTDARKRTAPRF